MSAVDEDMTTDDLQAVDAWWRAANYLSVGQIYLRQNALLSRPLRAVDVKSRLLGHWGTTPGLNFIWAHLNRMIIAQQRAMLLVVGPGHGGSAVLANGWLEGTYSELYSGVDRGERGMNELFRQFSYPGGVPSHAAPNAPGSINEGGELGYSLAHAYGAAFDHPDLVAAAIIGDGEAETGALSASWLSTSFLNPATDGAVLPILHLNGYKIANPTVLARMPQEQLLTLMRGYGYAPRVVAVDDPHATEQAHRDFAAALEECLAEIDAIQHAARSATPGKRHNKAGAAPAWPMIIFRSPKGWTGPAEVDGLQVEGTWRSHQVPLDNARDDEQHRRLLEEWMRSYRPEDLFEPDGTPASALDRLRPSGDLRLSGTPFANGGRLLKDLRMPAAEAYMVDVVEPGRERVSAMLHLGSMLSQVIDENRDNFRLFGPDETASNRLQNVFDITTKAWQTRIDPVDENLSPTGRVMEVLSEHLCQGWLEGYLLTGRHGVFNCYEAFVHIVDSMFNQHAKWLKVHRKLPWRQPVASLNYVLSSHVWQQDHNGFSHQDPGFLDHVVNKTAEVIRIYLPPDINTLISTADHCLRSRDCVNVIVAGKQPALTWLTPDQAQLHCTAGLGIWDFAGSETPGELPDVVLACAGDVPTTETVAAAVLLREHLPSLRVRVVNVVDLMRLQPESEHSHGLSDREYDGIFTADRPTIFAFHGYPSLVHRLTYRRTNHANLHVRGYKEEGTTTTPFDMAMLNDIDRYRLVIDVIDRVPTLRATQAGLRQQMHDARTTARAHTRRFGEDPTEIRDWTLAR